MGIFIQSSNEYRVLKCIFVVFRVFLLAFLSCEKLGWLHGIYNYIMRVNLFISYHSFQSSHTVSWHLGPIHRLYISTCTVVKSLKIVSECN